MIQTYFPALVFLVLGAAVGVAFIAAGSLLGPRRAPAPTDYQDDPYESGLPSDVHQGLRFDISYYLMAMLFILFDIEVVFLYPIAVELKAFGAFAAIETIVFISLLVVALVYVWRRGALDWR